MVDEWSRLKETIDASAEFSPTVGYSDTQIPDKLPLPPDCPLEGYPVRIHQDPWYHKRWLELPEEGYLVSRPFAREKKHTSRRSHANKVYEPYTIPGDPRVLEPYVMRIHYFLRSVGDSEQ